MHGQVTAFSKNFACAHFVAGPSVFEWKGFEATKGITYSRVDAMPTSIITTVTTIIQPDGTVEQSTETTTTAAGGGSKRRPNKDLVVRLREHGQEHALAFWDDLTDAQQTALESDVSALALNLIIL